MAAVQPIRCFTAIPLDTELVQEISKLREALKGHISDSNIHWIPQLNWHLTLTFIGNLHLPQIEDLGDQLRARYAGYRGSQVAMQRIGWFPNDKKARILAIELALNPELLALKLRSDMAVKDLGLNVDPRAFRPHISLARAKGVVKTPLMQAPSLPLVALFINQINLYASEAGSTGVRYRVLNQIMLT